MTAEMLAGFAGVILSLVFAYVPGVGAWYAALTGEGKRLVMLGLVLAAGVAVFGLSCAGWAAALGLPVLACDQSGLLALAKILFLTLVGNQATFLIAPKRSR